MLVMLLISYKLNFVAKVFNFSNKIENVRLVSFLRVLDCGVVWCSLSAVVVER